MNNSKKNNLLDVDSLINRTISVDDKNVADLGCGSFGYFVFPLAKKIGNHGQVFAVDIVKENLESIKQMAKLNNLTQVQTIWSNLEVYKGTKIEDDYLDAVFLISTLHQSEKFIEILKESVRMLKSGGKMLIVEWLDDNPIVVNKNIKKIDKNFIKVNLEKLNLRLKDEFSAGDHHYGLLLIKN